MANVSDDQKDLPEEIQDRLGESLGDGLPDGTYHCTTSCRIFKGDKQSKKVPYVNGESRVAVWCVITYVVSDPSSKYYSADNIKDWFELFPDIDDPSFADLDPDEKSYIRKQLNDRVVRFRQLGVPEARLWRFSEDDLTDLEVNVTVTNSVSRQDSSVKFLNIKKIQLATQVKDDVFSID